MADSDDFLYDPDSNYDEAISSQMRHIEQEVNQRQDYLISTQLNFAGLEDEYEGDTVYLAKIESLKQKYSCMRRTRGDGNCFYRAFGFAYLEWLRMSPQECAKFKAAALRAKDDLTTNFGYQQFTVEDFYDKFADVLDMVAAGCEQSELEAIFNDLGQSDYLVVYLRLIVSSYLQKESAFFLSFLEGSRSMKEFCGQEVEPMGRESDHVHITALTQATGACILVEYMDRGALSAEVNTLVFPDDGSCLPQIYLLYRPGHYDILYKKSD